MQKRITAEELDEAHQALLSLLRSVKTSISVKLGKPQQTLLARRIAALKVALLLIEKSGPESTITLGIRRRLPSAGLSRVYRCE
jgi:hypothetical protein